MSPWLQMLESTVSMVTEVRVDCLHAYGSYRRLSPWLQMLESTVSMVTEVRDDCLHGYRS